MLQEKIIVDQKQQMRLQELERTSKPKPNWDQQKFTIKNKSGNKVGNKRTRNRNAI